MKQIVVISEDSLLTLLINRICLGLVPVHRRSTLGPIGQLIEPTILIIDSSATRTLDQDVMAVARLRTTVVIIVVVSESDAGTAVRVFRHGVHDCIIRPIVESDVRQIIARHLPQVGAVGALGDRAVCYDRVGPPRQAMRSPSVLEKPAPPPQESLLAAVQPEFGGLIGYSEGMCQLRHAIQRVAKRESRVMIIGETGSGKELVAQAIHQLSVRARGSFVALNIAAIPNTLVESELFGVARGAFTDAAPRAGVLLRANGGTIFFDEIGELLVETQAKLLRVLEEGTVTPVGGSVPQNFSARVIAATNQPLAELMRDKRFRADLFYRLTAIRIIVPPLRDRLEDLPVLVPYLLKRVGAPERMLTPAAWRMLADHHWPGNVRELLHVLDRAVTFSEGSAIEVEDLDFYPDLEARAGCAGRAPSDPRDQFSRRTWYATSSGTNWP